MRIFIITMDDPVQTKDFIRKIIDTRTDEIVGLAIPNGDRLTLSKGKSKYEYVISLFLIMGPWHFFKNAWVSVLHKTKKKLHSFKLSQDPTIKGYASKKGIPVFRIKTPNNKEFRQQLRDLKPDIIINQSQSIIKKELLEIPTIGVLNRHNALLPKNRGRLTPFWVLFKGEKETGVSIHFVVEALDAGEIIVQEKYSVSRKDTFNSLVKKNYEIAPKAMLKAIDLLENGFKDFLPNADNDATYNTTPTLKEAWEYRKKRII
jgi:methionyl-tRNA formyltransferase